MPVDTVDTADAIDTVDTVDKVYTPPVWQPTHVAYVFALTCLSYVCTACLSYVCTLCMCKGKYQLMPTQEIVQNHNCNDASKLSEHVRRDRRLSAQRHAQETETRVPTVSGRMRQRRIAMTIFTLRYPLTNSRGGQHGTFSFRIRAEISHR